MDSLMYYNGHECDEQAVIKSEEDFATTALQMEITRERGHDFC